jgi:uncharacterized protein YqeY
MDMRSKVHADMTSALKEASAGPEQKLRLTTLRVLFSEIRNAEIAKGHELDDAEVTDVIVREVKRRREAADEAAKVRRGEIAEREIAEAAVLTAYLPEQMSDEELGRLVDQGIAETGASGPKEMGKVMGWLVPRIKGRADSKQASAMVAERLAGSAAGGGTVG